MKVAFVVGAFPADTSHLRALSKEAEVILYGTRYGPWYQWDPEPPAECESRVFDPIRMSRRGQLHWVYPGLARTLDRDAPDVVHVVSEPWGTLAQQVTSWARRSDSSVLAIHGCDRIWWHGHPVEIRVKRWLARRSLSRADAFAAETEDSLALARNAGLRSGATTAEIHTNPRDATLLRPSTLGERSQARSRLHLPVDGIGVGFIGAMRPEKGPLLLLEAIEGVQPGCWLAFAGEGPIDEKVCRRVEDLGHHFLGSLAYPDEVLDFYRAVDAIVVPSYAIQDWDDQSPRTVIEGMMMGCLVIGAESGGIPSMIGDGGLTFPEKDVPALRRVLVELVRSGVPHPLVRRARERSLGKYSGEATAAQLLGMWQEALTTKRSQAR